MDLVFGLIVQARTRLVEDHQLPPAAQQGPGECDSLPLPARQQHPGRIRQPALRQRRVLPLCWTRANHNGNRASTVPQAAAPPTKTGSSPTAVISSSATGRAPGSAAKNSTAPSGGSAKFSQPKALNARTYPAPGAAAAITARLLTSGSPKRFDASITTLSARAAALATTTSPTAPPGTASTTTSAPVTASPTGTTGAPPGPTPDPAREPYTTSWPAARHRRPSAPPTCPAPTTAIFMLASNPAVFPDRCGQLGRRRLRAGPPAGPWP